MKIKVNTKLLGEVVYEESAWTGKTEIYVDGTRLNKVRRNQYHYKGEIVEVKGNALRGVKLIYRRTEIGIMPSPKWYEYMLSFFVFISYIVWSHSQTLVEIFPTVGGMIGAALAAATTILCLNNMRKANKLIYKILIWLAALVGTFVLGLLAVVAMLEIFGELKK